MPLDREPPAGRRTELPPGRAGRGAALGVDRPEPLRRAAVGRVGRTLIGLTDGREDRVAVGLATGLRAVGRAAGLAMAGRGAGLAEAGRTVGRDDLGATGLPTGLGRNRGRLHRGAGRSLDSAPSRTCRGPLDRPLRSPGGPARHIASRGSPHGRPGTRAGRSAGRPLDAGPLQPGRPALEPADRRLDRTLAARPHRAGTRPGLRLACHSGSTVPSPQRDPFEFLRQPRAPVDEGVRIARRTPVALYRAPQVGQRFGGAPPGLPPE